MDLQSKFAAVQNKQTINYSYETKVSGRFLVFLDKAY